MTASLSDKVLMIEEACRRRRIPHAFGGALAQAYYATPRATLEIDVNVFLSIDRANEVLGSVQPLGVESISDRERAQLQCDSQARVQWDGTPVNLLFAYDALHESCLERRRRMPFGEGDWIHVLAAEDLLVFKTLFDRPKDWRNLEELVFALGDGVDADYAREWLERILGRHDPRYQRLCCLLDRYA